MIFLSSLNEYSVFEGLRIMPLDRIPKEEFLLLGISAKDLDILTHDLEHQCSKSALMHCCNEWRCEACQVLHIRAKHKERISTFWRFHQSLYLITQSKALKESENHFNGKEESARRKKALAEQSSKKENKTRTQSKALATELAESLSIQEIEELMALLKSL